MRTVLRIAGAAGMAGVLASCAPSASKIGPTPKAPANSNYVLYARDGHHQIEAVDASTGTVLRRLPLGTPAPDWSRLYVAVQQSGKTVVRSIDARTGAPLRERSIDSGFGLPPTNALGDPGGLSPNGRWLVVQRHMVAGLSRSSDFMIFDTSLDGAPRLVSLQGDFSFDGLDNTASRLFLIESLNATDPGHYRVRYYDLRRDALDPKVIVDKREATATAAMSGVRLSGVFAPDGSWQYSLYVSPRKGAFIHALNLSAQFPFAWCIDLPGQRAALAAQRMWSLAITPGGGRLYAVNPVLGLVATVNISGDGPEGDVSMTRPFHPAGAPSAALGSAVVSSDASTVFAASGKGLLNLDANALTLRNNGLSGRAVSKVVASSDGAWLFVSDGASTQILRWNPSTGQQRPVVSAAAGWTLYGAEAMS